MKELHIMIAGLQRGNLTTSILAIFNFDNLQFWQFYNSTIFNLAIFNFVNFQY